MIDADVIIVGGGPSGSSCAYRLRQLEIDCALLDRQEFPRLKLCAGWITPQVVTDLAIDIAHYPHSFLTFAGLRIHLGPLRFTVHTTQHSIRRYEFDTWLLKRSGVPVYQHDVKHIERAGDRYVVDGEFRCRYLVGAGGTKCPVFRQLFRAANPRAKDLQVVTIEQEFPYRWHDPDCHLWFLFRGLPGYAWYVPKQNGWLNVGIGGSAEAIKRRGKDIRWYWDAFIRMLAQRTLVTGQEFETKGYSYYRRGNIDVTRIDDAFIVGDSCGLASADLGEGIGPAVQSGIRAAEAIATGTTYSLESIKTYNIYNDARRRLDRWLGWDRKRQLSAEPVTE